MCLLLILIIWVHRYHIINFVLSLQFVSALFLSISVVHKFGNLCSVFAFDICYLMLDFRLGLMNGSFPQKKDNGWLKGASFQDAESREEEDRI